MISKQSFQKLFEKTDTDHDGKVSVDEAVQLFKAIGRNIYKPKLIKIFQFINHELLSSWTDEKMKATCDQLWSYNSSLQNPLRKQLWNIIHEMKVFKHKWEQEIGVVNMHDRESRGNVRFKVGEKTEYDNNIHLKFKRFKQKFQNQNLKCDIFLSLKDQKQGNKMLGEVQKLIIFLKEIAVNEDPGAEDILNSTQIDVKLQNGGVVVSIEVKEEMLKNFQQTLEQFVFTVFSTSLQFDVDVEYMSNFPIMKYLDREQTQVSLLQLITEDTQVNLSWGSGDLISGFKKLVTKLAVLDNFKYDPYHSSGLFLIFILNSEMLSGEFEFENTPINYEKDEIHMQLDGRKMELLNQLEMVGGMLANFQEVDLVGILQSIGESIKINLSLANLTGQISIRAKELPQLLEKIVNSEGIDSEDS